MASPPKSLLRLIDYRNRLEGEVLRIQRLRRQVEELKTLLQEALTDVDMSLDVHRIQIDRAVLAPTGTSKQRTSDATRVQ